MNDVQEQVACVYCGGEAKLFGKNARHPYAPGYGPFQLYRCRSCSSLLTSPVPSDEALTALYASFDQGMHKKARELRTRYPLRTWFRQCLEHMLKGTSLKADTAFSWIDIGAGEGEMCGLLQQHYPQSKGIAIDFHGRPENVNHDVDWIQADLNHDLPATNPANLVFALTVLEHMADPRQFIRSSLALLKPGSVFYLNCPRADSNAFRIMGRKWPYYLPGEHITIPSIKGLEQLMRDELDKRFKGHYKLKIDPVIIPYPLGFYLGYFLPFNSILFSLPMDVYFPTGLLECQVIIHG